MEHDQTVSFGLTYWSWRIYDHHDHLLCYFEGYAHPAIFVSPQFSGIQHENYLSGADLYDSVCYQYRPIPENKEYIHWLVYRSHLCGNDTYYHERFRCLSQSDVGQTDFRIEKKEKHGHDEK